MVAFLCVSCRNENVCELYFFLKSSVLPMYVLGSSSVVVAVSSYAVIDRLKEGVKRHKYNGTPFFNIYLS